MSKQFPAQQAGRVPVTMNSFPNWNQSPHQQPQGQVVPPGTPQSVTQEVLPQLLSSGSPQKVMKLMNVPHNGAGGLMPASVISQSSQAPLSESLKQNFQMYINQNQKSSNITSPLTPASGASKDITYSPWTGDQSISVPSVAHQSTKDVIESPSAISQTGVSGQFNGEINSRASAVVSAVANTTLSPSKVVSSTAQSTDVNTSQAQDLGGSALKQEPQYPINQTSSSQPEKVDPKQKTVEPPLKKLKQEESVKCVTTAESVGSTPLLSTSISKAQETSLLLASTNESSTRVCNNSSKQDVMDVESQLEALFAGIADDGNSSKESKPLPGTTSNQQGTPNVAAVLECKRSTAKKGKGKANGVVKNSDVGVTSSTESTPKKKKKKKKPPKPWEDDKIRKGKTGSTSKGKYVKEASCDSGSNASSTRVRGPVVHIEGTKAAPTSLTVVNAPSRQDDEDNDSKRKALSAGRVRKGHIVEGKVTSTGLCGNSLMSRYEAHSSDPRWVCVFCKKGSHIDGLGDLFGPYLLNHDSELENSLDSDLDAKDKKDNKKTKRSGIGQTGVLGLLAIPPLPGEQPQFMVYFHENCGVWSPSINLIGTRLTGIQEAVWVAVRSKCSRCFLDGANIGCVAHGCSCQAHFPCARDGGWNIDEDTFISSCQTHKKMYDKPLLPANV